MMGGCGSLLVPWNTRTQWLGTPWCRRSLPPISTEVRDGRVLPVHVRVLHRLGGREQVDNY